MSTASCVDASNILVQQTGFIGPKIFKQLRLTDPWMARVTQTPFPEGEGLSQAFTRIAQVIPTDPTYTDLGTSVFATPASSCNPTPNVIAGPGITTVNYNLGQYAFRSPELCLMDLINSKNASQLINAYIDQLRFVTKWYWNRTHQTQFTLLSGRKIIAAPSSVDSSMPEGTTTFPLTLPTTTPVQGILDVIYQDLQFEGITAPTNEVGQPIFDMFLSAAASQSLIKSDPSYRKDSHYVQEMANANFAGPRGYNKKDINGWRHNIIQFPARWSYTGGAWVEVKPFDSGTATTVGNIQRVTAAYKNALYEDLYIFPDDQAYQVAVPSKTRSFGSAKFPGPMYAGDFEWFNQRTLECNPYGDTGVFLGRIIQGGYSPRPEFAIVIRFLRANYAIVPRDNTFDPNCPCITTI